MNYYEIQIYQDGHARFTGASHNTRRTLACLFSEYHDKSERNVQDGVVHFIKLFEIMRPLLPVDVIHDILEVDATTAALIRDVHLWSQRVKVTWQAASRCNIEVVSGDGERRAFITTRNGQPSAIPVYSHCTWTFNNPFDVEWPILDTKSVDTIVYLGHVLNCLTRVAIEWGNDSETVLTVVFSCFVRFIENLDELFHHATSMRTLRAGILAEVIAPAA